MRVYAQVTKCKTKLGGASGYAEYMTDVDKQRADGVEILAASEPIDWKPYEVFEKESKHRTKGDIVDGRKIEIGLPHSFLAEGGQLKEGVDIDALVRAAIGKDSDYQWAVHYGKKGAKYNPDKPRGDRLTTREHDNLHLHVVFSERTKTHDIPKYDRDVWHDKDGKVAKRKADRVKQVAKKGDYRGLVLTDKEGRSYTLTPKDKSYADEFVYDKTTKRVLFVAGAGYKHDPNRSKEDEEEARKTFKERMRERLAAEFERQGQIIDPPNAIKHFKRGRGPDSPEIKEKNRPIKYANSLIERFRNDGRDDDADKLKKEMNELKRERSPSDKIKAHWNEWVRKWRELYDNLRAFRTLADPVYVYEDTLTKCLGAQEEYVMKLRDKNAPEDAIKAAQEKYFDLMRKFAPEDRKRAKNALLAARDRYGSWVQDFVNPNAIDRAMGVKRDRGAR